MRGNPATANIDISANEHAPATGSSPFVESLRGLGRIRLVGSGLTCEREEPNYSHSPTERRDGESLEDYNDRLCDLENAYMGEEDGA